MNFCRFDGDPTQGPCQFGNIFFFNGLKYHQGSSIRGLRTKLVRLTVAAAPSRGSRRSGTIAAHWLRTTTVDAQKLDELATQLNKLVPASLRDAGEDLRSNFRAVAQAWFDRLDLVTREEFDAQRAVLQRTREKLEELTKRIDER